jgi:hypothetical protein
MTQTVNIITVLVEALEGMALQYLSDYAAFDPQGLLQGYRNTDRLTLKALEKLGKIVKMSAGCYRWSEVSEYHASNKRLSEENFFVLTLPDSITLEELVEAVKVIAKEYLTYGSEAWMTHSFMSAGEQTLKVLASLGLVKTEDDITYHWIKSNDTNS